VVGGAGGVVVGVLAAGSDLGSGAVCAAAAAMGDATAKTLAARSRARRLIAAPEGSNSLIGISLRYEGLSNG